MATPRQARPELYSAAFSAISDPSKKLSAEAQKEFNKASAAVRSKTGQIELYSPSFYAASTIGGLLACVSNLLMVVVDEDDHICCAAVLAV